MKIGRLHVITDTTLQQRFSHLDLARLTLEGGADTIQYRQKTGATRLRIQEAIELRALCRKKRVVLIVNDRADIALAADADGVHLGADDLPPLIARDLLGPVRLIGGSADDAEEAAALERAGLDYAGIGPIFATQSKSNAGPVLGLAGLEQAVERCRMPLIAIGGITLQNVEAVLRTGVHGVAILSAVVCADDPTVATRAFAEAIVAARGGSADSPR
ncbi:MAG: thiamine phosphate synthase [Candidatus Eisenbacteria bacterium]|nr:thiamine phosphate synthase [Candidatus Eisenbacteria bacterium]